jgi:pilus assembly protein CpaB
MIVKKVKILALLSAIVTALLLFVFLSSLIKFGGSDTSKIVTAAQDIPANTLITQEMLESTDVPTDAVLPGAITKMSDVVGKAMKSDVYIGEQIISAKIIVPGETGDGALSYAIEPGMRAITIGVDSTAGVAGMLRPSDRIDLMGEYDVAGTVYTDLVAEYINILAVDNILSETGKAADGGTPGYTTITLEVTPQQAMEISMATYSGTLRAVLRSPLDDVINNYKSVTLVNVLNNI